MKARLRLWWQQITKHRVPILVAIILIVAIVLIIIEVRVYGTGFAGKPLWDWLNLLGVLAIPAVVGLGGAWYTAQQGKVSARDNTDNQRETALQTYLDRMSELLLREHLLTSNDYATRQIARARTLTTLQRLDPNRKGALLQFLYEARLIRNGETVITLSSTTDDWKPLLVANLSEANLLGAELARADLHGTNLGRANLSKANLFQANLQSADLNGADLSEANLVQVDLQDADLSRANLQDATGITVEELKKQACSLKGATMPDGSIHP